MAEAQHDSAIAKIAFVTVLCVLGAGIFSAFAKGAQTTREYVRQEQNKLVTKGCNRHHRQIRRELCIKRKLAERDHSYRSTQNG